MSSTGDKTSLAVVNTFEGIATVKILVQEQVCKKKLKKERGKFKKGQSLEKCMTDVKKKKAWKSWKEFSFLTKYSHVSDFQSGQVQHLSESF